MITEYQLLEAVHARDINYVVRCLQAGESAEHLTALVTEAPEAAFSVDPHRAAKIKGHWLRAIAENKP